MTIRFTLDEVAEVMTKHANNLMRGASNTITNIFTDEDKNIVIESTFDYNPPQVPEAVKELFRVDRKRERKG